MNTPPELSAAEQRSRALTGLQEFLNTPFHARLSGRRATEPIETAIALFHDVAARVPAYQSFLLEHGVDFASVCTAEEFRRLPLTTKGNYLLKHPLADLCRGGKLETCDMIAVSSGSTGKPTFWPRFLVDELRIATRFEQVFYDSFHADTRRTLAVVCFALGTWVGGMYTANCCRYLAAKGYPVTVITPGNNKAEILRVVKELGPAFEQVVLLGYPPFLKDVIDTGLMEGIDWSRYKIKLVMAGEVFSEEWRTLVGQRVGAESPLTDSASLYGTADAGVLGNETPLSIAIRRFLAECPEAAHALFGEPRLPTLVQYDPHDRFFETHEGTLLFTGDNGVPLIRYHISDQGGLIGYDEMLKRLREWGFDPIAAVGGPGARGVHPLPFVYVFGRSHFVISYFGANIYPENVTVGLEQPGVSQWVTGKFVMESKEDADKNRYLSITVELAPGVEADEAKRATITASILHHLTRLNSEFAHYVPEEYRVPRVRLLPAGDPEYFPVGVKHRYTRRES